MKVSVVIPSYNNWQLTHSLLLNIYKHLPQDVEIIVVDDCSPEKGITEGLLWWKTTLLSVRLRTFVNDKNFGFLRTANFGVSKASGDVVILINTDVSINDSTLVPKILKALEHPEPTLVGCRLLSGDTGWNKDSNGTIYPYLEGWLLAFKKDKWDEYGGFDLRYTQGDFEDVDISTTYLSHNGNLISIDMDVVHLGAQSYKYSPEREANTKLNQNRFFEKWSKNG